MRPSSTIVEFLCLLISFIVIVILDAVITVDYRKAASRLSVLELRENCTGS